MPPFRLSLIRRRWRGFSAPKGVERACPPVKYTYPPSFAITVSVPRRALRGHAPNLICYCLFSHEQVSVPRRALRGHAPGGVRYRGECHDKFQCPEGR